MHEEAAGGGHCLPRLFFVGKLFAKTLINGFYPWGQPARQPNGSIAACVCHGKQPSAHQGEGGVAPMLMTLGSGHS